MGGAHDNVWVPLTSTEAEVVLSSVSAVAHKRNSDLETVGGLSFNGVGRSFDVVSSIFNATLRSHTSNLWRCVRSFSFVSSVYHPNADLCSNLPTVVAFQRTVLREKNGDGWPTQASHPPR